MARMVLVHGAFSGAWSWEPVVGPLEAAGHTVERFDLPGSGDDPAPVQDVTLDAYADRICEVLHASDEPSVLVGHSMGGVAITHAAARCPDRIALLIYVAAFLPGDRQSLLDLTGLPEGADDHIQANIVISGDPPVAAMPDPAARTGIYGLATDEQFAWAMERRRPQAVAPFAAPVSIHDDISDRIPRTYVHALQDRSIPLALQRRMVHDRPCLDVVELDSDHVPQLSATTELVSAMDRLAGIPYGLSPVSWA